MVSPQTWYGYDEENNRITSCTAVNVSQQIRVDQLENKVHEIVEQARSDFQKNASYLRIIGNKSKDETKIMEVTKCDEAIEKVVSEFTSANIAGQIEDGLNSLVDVVRRYIDMKQEEENERAQNNAWGAKVVRVSTY